jgi:hypothetical protein
MAQLRDAHSSELLFVGTPIEVVALAEKLGRDEVVFDDVGLEFDPDAVLKAHEARLAGLEAAAKDSEQPVTEAAVKAARAEGKPSAALVKKVNAQLSDVRSRLG